MSNGAWHPDPTERWELRWFDRSGWTDHVRRGETVGVDPLSRDQQPANWQPRYFAEVNRKGLNVNRLSKVLNERFGARLHDLRDAYATMLLERGVNPGIASAMLGHASAGFTLTTYSHVVDSMTSKAAAEVEAALGG